MLRQTLRFPNQFFPQVGFGHQQARCQVLLNLLLGGQRFRGSQALLEYSKAQRISEFKAMETREIQGNGIGLTPGIRPG